MEQQQLDTPSVQLLKSMIPTWRDAASNVVARFNLKKKLQVDGKNSKELQVNSTYFRRLPSQLIHKTNSSGFIDLLRGLRWDSVL